MTGFSLPKLATSNSQMGNHQMSRSHYNPGYTVKNIQALNSSAANSWSGEMGYNIMPSNLQFNPSYIHNIHNKVQPISPFSTPRSMANPGFRPQEPAGSNPRIASMGMVQAVSYLRKVRNGSTDSQRSTRRFEKSSDRINESKNPSRMFICR